MRHLGGLLGIVLSACLSFGSVFAQTAATSGVSQSYVDGVVAGVVAAMPKPASVVPPVDVYGGAVGSDSSTFQRADAARPRITRSMLVTTNASGVATADWSSQPLGPGAVVILTPIYSGASAPKCWSTAAATPTGVPIKCIMENTAGLTLAIITSGITLNTPASGIQVNVVVIPASQ